MQFFYFLKSMFWEPKKGFFFFSLKYRQTHLFGLFCLNLKNGKNLIFYPKSWIYSFLKIFTLFCWLIRLYNERSFSPSQNYASLYTDYIFRLRLL